MQAADSDAFEAILDRLGKAFGREVDDDVIGIYWQALRDQPLGIVRSFADHHIKTAKFFPKPFELRPKEEKRLTRDSAADAAFNEAERRCIANLEELRKRDPEAHRREVGIRQLDRILATQHPGSSMYEAAMNERWPAVRP